MIGCFVQSDEMFKFLVDQLSRYLHVPSTSTPALSTDIGRPPGVTADQLELV